MFLLKLKFALRSLWRATTFTYTNLIGLAVSIGAILCIYMYVSTEWATDSQFKERENIYRIIRTVEGPTSSYQTSTLAAPFREQLQFDLTLEKSDVLRVLQEDELVSYENSVFFEPNFLYADENFFHILDFPFHLGNPEHALSELNSVVLSRQLARKYFGDQNPIGKILEIDGKGSLEVTGVLATPLQKSHLSIDFVANLGSVGYTGRILQDRESHVMSYYLRIP
ncbi:MAG: ABC transporter permease, partial [Bacteroidota bacterium]